MAAPAATAYPPAGVPRVAAPAADDFERAYVRRPRPVVLTGLLDGWTGRAGWSLEALRAAHGDAPVAVARVRDGAVVVDPGRGLVADTTALGAFVDAVLAGAGVGYLMARAEDLPAALRRELPVPPYCAGARWRVSKLWVTGAEAVSALHRDLADNLHTVVAGAKLVTLVAPDQGAGVYPHGLLAGVPNGARVNPERPDYDRYPRSRHLRPLTARLGAGDTLFIPRGWWHHVRSAPGTVAVNTWWARGARVPVVVAADVFKRLRGLSR